MPDQQVIAPSSPPVYQGGRGHSELHPELAKRLWKPGQSGNPGGKGGLYKETQRLAREISPRAMQRLIKMAELEVIDETGQLAEISKNSDPRVVAAAAGAILDRAWGKPKEYDPQSEEVQPQPIDPAQFTAKQRALVRQVLQMLLAAEPLVTIEETENVQD